MNTGRAAAIFRDINSEKYSDEEKGLAILTVSRMETLNSITKTDMLYVISYLWKMIYMEGEEESE